jgi:DNA-binding transcriptional MerR regulator
MRHDGIAIGELLRQAGGNVETIRYCERIGLLPLPNGRGGIAATLPQMFGD